MIVFNLLWDYVVYRFRLRVEGLYSINTLYNLLFALLIHVITIYFLHREAAKEDTPFMLYGKTIIGMFLLLMIGVVFLAPPSLADGNILVKGFSYGVLFIVFGITSCTDFQTGMFRAGYMIVGVLVTGIFTLMRVPAWIRTGNGTYLILAVAGMGCNLFLGTFAYQFGDAILYLMAQFCMLLWLSPTYWIAAMVVGLVSAMAYLILLYGKAFMEGKGNRKSRFPFTKCLFLGSLTTFFLFL